MNSRSEVLVCAAAVNGLRGFQEPVEVATMCLLNSTAHLARSVARDTPRGGLGQVPDHCGVAMVATWLPVERRGNRSGTGNLVATRWIGPRRAWA